MSREEESRISSLGKDRSRSGVHSKKDSWQEGIDGEPGLPEARKSPDLM